MGSAVQPPTGAPDCARQPPPGHAVVVLKSGAPGFTMDDMRAFLTEKGAARQYRPERPELLPELPRTASGARLALTAALELHRGARRALATMCIGVGQGIAVLFEAA